jgi:hypothetical protein
MAVVLTFVLANRGFAGIIGTVPEVPPPPSDQQQSSSSLVATVAVTLIQIAISGR